MGSFTNPSGFGRGGECFEARLAAGRLTQSLNSRTKRKAAERLGEDFEWDLIAQPFAMAIIQFILDHRKSLIGDFGKASIFRDELACLAIELLFGAELPA
jgi:hypothetical protein